MLKTLTRTFSNTSKHYDTMLEMIKGNPVTVFTKSTCPFCNWATQKLNSMEISPYVVEIDKHPDGKALHQELTNSFKQSTVPYIFITQQLVGGYDELMNGLQQGKVQDMLEKANIEYKDN